MCGRVCTNEKHFSGKWKERDGGERKGENKGWVFGRRQGMGAEAFLALFSTSKSFT